MKILQINKFFYLRGGSERYMFELSELLAENGHEVIHFSMAGDHNLPSKFSPFFADKVNVNNFSPAGLLKSFYNYDAVKKLEKLIKAEKPDIAHLHNISHHLSPAVIKVLKRQGVKIVMTLHDYKIICPNRLLFTGGQVCARCEGKSFYHCLARKCIQNSRAKSLIGMLEAYFQKWIKTYDQVDLFIAPSRFLRDLFVKYGVAENKIAVLNNFIADKFYESGQFTEISGQAQKDYLIFFGRLSPEKGIDVLIEALSKTDHRLKIIGAGPEYNNIKSRIKKLKLTGRVKLTGPKYGDQLKSEIINSSAVILPSIWPENMPYSLLEAMALGKIVIASNIGGMPEIIKDGVNGFLFEPGQSDDLSAAIHKLSGADKFSITNNAVNTIKKIGAGAHYQKIIGFYHSLLA